MWPLKDLQGGLYSEVTFNIGLTVNLTENNSDNDADMDTEMSIFLKRHISPKTSGPF